ncbi:MAG TPA: tRNA glutamyl-Q(34) synthetase GluQRS [Beijerinckiaceae bacterium]|nr:tRNA glutamyl-Q(34) synthetase GluQRS [Beijerinckiaceae bacterium]
MTQPVLRFAPSPNGRLHLGHAYSALLNADLAQAWRGRFLLRIEDIDVTRCRPDFEAAVYADLAWLGLAWEVPVRRQSQHFADYRAAAERLQGRGLLYPCFCSRADIAAAAAEREGVSGMAWPRDPDGAPLYPGTCRTFAEADVRRRIAAGEPHALRLDMRAALRAAPPPHVYTRVMLPAGKERVAAAPGRWGDAVIVRKEIPASYHLAVVCDDALQGVTHVVRGRDLEAATNLHVLLQKLLALPSPAYHHHALIRDVGGDKLAKSASSEPLAALRERGATPAQVRAALGFPDISGREKRLS